jgi:penicillin amidase
MRQFLRFLLWMTALVVVGAIVVAIGARVMVGRSLPVLDGSLTLGGLSAPVTVTRDALGIPTVTAGSRVDLARAGR